MRTCEAHVLCICWKIKVLIQDSIMRVLSMKLIMKTRIVTYVDAVPKDGQTCMPNSYDWLKQMDNDAADIFMKSVYD